MDFELKLKALQRLVESDTELAKDSIFEEFHKAKINLENENDYHELERNLKIINLIGFRHSQDSLKLLEYFINVIEKRNLIYQKEYIEYYPDFKDTYNAYSLIKLAILALSSLMYLETENVFKNLISLTNHGNESVKQSAKNAIKKIVKYNIDVFYGTDDQPGIGAQPQLLVVTILTGFKKQQILQHFQVLLELIDCLVSPEMEGVSSTYKTITISRRKTPIYEDIIKIRELSLKFLKRMYRFAITQNEKIGVINALSNATRILAVSLDDTNELQMFIKDTKTVLKFYEKIVSSNDLMTIEKIEHNSYWIYYHAVDKKIEKAALKVSAAISMNHEYQIFKILIGFDGIHFDWHELKSDDNVFEKEEKYRKSKAEEFAKNISKDNFPEWTERILLYASIESNDLATFPIFHYYLEKLSLYHPELIIKLLQDESKKLENFIITILRSLSVSEKNNEACEIVVEWIKEGIYLTQCVRQYIDNNTINFDILDRLLEKSIEIKDFRAISSILIVVVSNYNEDSSTDLIDKYFVPSLKVLNENNYIDWIFDFWFRRKSKYLFKDISDEGLKLILINLLNLKKIDYHAEEILYQIAVRSPDNVFIYFCERIDRENEIVSPSKYEAIPFTFHKLSVPLSAIPGLAISKMYEKFILDEPLFQFRGARLLKNIFENFTEEFQAELLKVAKIKKDKGIRFVLTVIRCYEGKTFIYPVCKEIVKLIPSDSKIRVDIAIALDSTGVVSGEYGFANAYEEKKNLVSDWLNDEDDKIKEFASWYIENLNSMIENEKQRVKQEIELRKHNYGE